MPIETRLPPLVETAVRTAIRGALEAGRTQRQRTSGANVEEYAVDRVTCAWIEAQGIALAEKAGG